MYSNITKGLRRVALPFLILGATVAVIFLLFSLRPVPEKRPNNNVLPVVRTMPAEPNTHSPVVTLYGRVESPRESNLASTINAFVEQVMVQEGEIVKADQILVQLEDSEVRLAYEQRWAEVEDIKAQIASEKQRYASDLKALEIEEQLLAMARKSTQRYKTLRQKNMVSEQNLDDILQKSQSQELSMFNREFAVQDYPNRLKRLNAQLTKITALRDQAALDLARTRISAPFDGRVTKVPISPGNRLRPGDIVVSMFDINKVEVRAQIPSRYLNQVEKALAEGMELNAGLTLNEDIIPLRLQRMAGAISQGQGGVDALFSLEQPGRLATLGRAGEVYLNMPSIEDSLALPPTAIYGQERIYTIDDGVLNTIKIKRLGEVLTESGERWQLVHGNISAGANILITQLSNAVGGLRVQPSERSIQEPPVE